MIGAYWPNLILAICVQAAGTAPEARLSSSLNNIGSPGGVEVEAEVEVEVEAEVEAEVGDEDATPRATFGCDHCPPPFEVGVGVGVGVVVGVGVGSHDVVEGIRVIAAQGDPVVGGV